MEGRGLLFFFHLFTMAQLRTDGCEFDPRGNDSIEIIFVFCFDRQIVVFDFLHLTTKRWPQSEKQMSEHQIPSAYPTIQKHALSCSLIIFKYYFKYFFPAFYKQTAMPYPTYNTKVHQKKHLVESITVQSVTQLATMTSQTTVLLSNLKKKLMNPQTEIEGNKERE